MKYFRILIFLLTAVSLNSYPVKKYDFHRPEFSPSPITAGLGGHNVTYFADPYAAFNNPALVCFVKKSKFSVSMRSGENSEIDFDKIISSETLFKKSKLAGIVFSGEKFALSYIPLADISRQLSDSLGTHKYLDYALNSLNLTIGETKGKKNWGFTVKGLWGRSVFLDYVSGSSLNFKDDKYMGFSTDFGFAFKDESVTYGFSAYDIFGRIYRKHSSDKNPIPRYSLGTGYSFNNSVFSLSWLGKISSFKLKDNTFHGGYSFLFPDINIWSYSGKALFRFGIYGSKFKRAKDTFLTFGAGFYMKAFRIDLSLTNNDLTAKNNRYLISVSAGI
ncbi:MAG: hypothetical protein CSB55_02630 [Candidatus Cloacimonadota bacterium]|nr:MAG: hypothetical protein CSB55_02630 [Candidatus Cloacimonadota bacterium]